MFLLLACAEGPVATTRLKPGDPHALVIILDGVRVEEITSDWASDLTGASGEAFATNTWDTVAASGTTVRSILNPVLTSTAPGHAAIVTGEAEPLFTIGFDDQGAAHYRPQLPTIFEAARRDLGWSKADTVLMGNSVVMQGVNRSVYPGLEDFAGDWVMVERTTGGLADDDTRAFDVLQDSIRGVPPPLLVVNIHDGDRVAHADGDYIGAVAEQDRELGALWRWLETSDPDYLDGLLVFVTSDHGRHRHDLDGGWTNHGDSCDGCREVPLLVAGDGVEAGVVASGTYTLLDIAPTIAAHLGVELPYAEGLPLSPVVGGVSGGRTGEVDVSTSGGRIATRAWLGDFTARSEVRVDGVAVSTPGIFAAEAPTLLVGTETWVCFRELSTTEEEGYLPWKPRCLIEEDGAWRDIGFPEDVVGPFFAPTLHEQDGDLWVAWLSTPLTRGDYGSDGVRLAHWSALGGWSAAEGPDTIFTTTDVTMTPTEDGFLLAGGINLPAPDEPYTRRIATWGFAASGADADREDAFQLEGLLDTPRRVERPALQADGAHVRLGMVAMDSDRRFVAAVESLDGGLTWGAPVALPGEGTPFMHLAPAWDGDELLWATLLEEDEAGLCRARVGDAEARCVSVGSPRIDSFGVSSGAAVVSVDAGVGAWEVGEVRW
jgi:hypothetical protein